MDFWLLGMAFYRQFSIHHDNDNLKVGFIARGTSTAVVGPSSPDSMSVALSARILGSFALFGLIVAF